MKRNIDIKEISDGKLYGPNDMVKADCRGCEGCSACCHGMGTSIVLTPLDIYRLEKELNASLGELMTKGVELNLADGVILPNLAMRGEKEACAFLNDSGRCTIHGARPDICRLFPLGRIYEEKGFRYFLQVYECEKKDRLKVKVKKWIDIPDPARHDKFISDWHAYLKKQEEILENDSSDESRKAVSMGILNTFYVRNYDRTKDFYEQFYERLEETEAVL